MYSYVRQNLTNPELSELHPEDKMLAIYSGVDLLLLVALPLRRPQVFEKVAKLRKRDPTLVKAEKLEGTHDVIRKLGYTVITQDHYEFPPEVTVAPDQVDSMATLVPMWVMIFPIAMWHTAWPLY